MNIWDFQSVDSALGLIGEVAWKSSLILLVAYTLHFAFCKRWPVVVSAIWNASLVALLILPITMFAPPLEVDYVANAPQTKTRQTTLPIEQRSVTINDSATPLASAVPSVHTSASTPVKQSQVPTSTPIATSERITFGYLLAVICICGGCLMSMRLLLAAWKLRQLVRGTEAINSSPWTVALRRWEAELSVKRHVKLCHSPATTIPFTCGVWRPTIVLPSELFELATPEERDVVLLHELTHVARRDCAWHWLLRCLEVAYWWQPLLWIAGRQMSNVRERVCDQFCVGTLGNREQYADGLLRVAESLTRPVELGVGLAMVRVPRIAARLHEIATGASLKRYRPASLVSALVLSRIVFGSGIIGAGVVDLVAESAADLTGDLHFDSLPPGAIARLGTTRLRHGSGVGELKYSRNGKLLTSKSGSWFYVWDPTSGKLLRREDLRGVFSLRVSDDTMMVAKNKSEALRPWKFTDPKAFPPRVERKRQDGLFGFDVADGAAPPPDNAQLGHFTMSPDGKTLATATYGQREEVARKIQLWKFEPNKKLTELKPLGKEWTSVSTVQDLIFSDNGRKLLVISKFSPPAGLGDKGNKSVTIMVCDVRDANKFTTMVVPQPAHLNRRSFAFSPDGKRFALGTNAAKLLIYDVTQQKLLKKLAVPAKPTTVLAFSPDGKQIAGGGRAMKVWIWDIETGKIQKELTRHLSWIEHLDFSPDGRTLASAGQDGVIHLWDVASGQRKILDLGHEMWVFGASLSTDGTLAATCGADGTTRIWDAATGKQRLVLQCKHEPWTSSCAFSPDGSQLAVAELRRVWYCST